MELASVPKPQPIDDPDNPGFDVIPEVRGWTEDDEPSRMAWWVRANLVVIGLGLSSVFIIGAWLHPYDKDGAPKTQETHRQLGLPACSFYVLTGQPCPSCGFTTSFSLVMHLDLLNALRANSVGTLLALFGLTMIPWTLASAWRRRFVLVQSAERMLVSALIVFVTLMLTRWGIVLGLAKLEGRI